MILLIQAITCSLAIAGLYYAADYELTENGLPTEKGVLWWYKWFFVSLLGDYFSKPFINCLRCMGSVYGVLYYVTMFEQPSHHEGILFIFVVSALNGLYARVID
jgi:hypothetical protein